MKKTINSNLAPDAIGPYSHAVQANNLIFISGQLPIDKNTGNFAGETIESQTKQCLENIRYILEASDLTLEHVVKTTVFLKNISDFVTMNDVYATYFKENCPARSAFEVANLPKNSLIEIEVIAVTDL